MKEVIIFPLKYGGLILKAPTVGMLIAYVTINRKVNKNLTALKKTLLKNTMVVWADVLITSVDYRSENLSKRSESKRTFGLIKHGGLSYYRFPNSVTLCFSEQA